MPGYLILAIKGQLPIPHIYYRERNERPSQSKARHNNEMGAANTECATVQINSRGSGEEEKKATFHIKKTAIPAARRGNRR